MVVSLRLLQYFFVVFMDNTHTHITVGNGSTFCCVCVCVCIYIYSHGLKFIKGDVYLFYLYLDNILSR